MKPYLLSLTSLVAGVENYTKTIKNLGDSVEAIMVSFAPTVPMNPAYRTINVPMAYPGNLSRFRYLPFDQLEDDRMLIFTDTSDVIFQTEIPELEQKIYVAPENDTFGEHSWFNQMFVRHNFTLLKDKPIYNMGTWAMPVFKAKEMVNFVTDGAGMFKFEEFGDQPLYNLWLQHQEFEEHPTLMSCLFNNYEKGNVLKTKEGFTNKEGDLYSIVHANGGLNLKELLIIK